MNDALACGLGVPFGLAQKKLDFLDSGMLQRFAVERFPTHPRAPSGRLFATIV